MPTYQLAWGVTGYGLMGL
uniref:Uncharacterized protein n=1 Tax=Phlebotomus papatasi TaxID=29031 RepID=A0A1B0CYR5_PHLPP